MFGFRVMKDLKKKLKRRRRPIWSLGMLAAVFLAASATGIGGAKLIQRAALDSADTALAPASESVGSESDKRSPLPSSSYRQLSRSRESALHSLADWKGDVEVTLRRTYWCGEEKRLLGRLTAAEASGLLRSRRDWDASFEKAGRLTLLENVEDLSPACRESAYIGLDADGNLTLYDGPPRKENVVRTFFQLDVKSLESSLSKERLRELIEGIKVSDRDEYNSVLSRFSDFAYRKSAKVMRSQP